MALSTILRLLMAAGRTKKAAKVGKAMLSKGKSLPKKSKDMPGVKTTKGGFEYQDLGEIPGKMALKGKWEGVSPTRYRPSREDVANFKRMGDANRALETARKRLMEAPRRATRAQFSRMPREATRLSPEVMRMIERLKVGERLPARTFKSAAERYAPIRGRKKPTVWDQMRAMADEFDDYPID
tara:strand:- start:94 stop:642 length:549 start_codon:yes stop_codon:yes gene_type:complete